jgi:hypothetical protein
VRELVVVAILAGLIFSNLFAFAPHRLTGMHGLYGIQRSNMLPFTGSNIRRYAPALVIVHTQKVWTEYGTLLDLQTPFLDTPFIFAVRRGNDPDARLAKAFPERKVYHYYADEPGKFYSTPK